MVVYMMNTHHQNQNVTVTTLYFSDQDFNIYYILLI